MSLILRAINFKQRHIQMYIAAIPVGELEHFSIDIWNPKNIVKRRGYQRLTDEKRVKNIAKYFEQKETIMPVAGLLNIRERGKIKYKDNKIIIPDGTKIWVVDMQHRLKGLLKAKEDGLLKNDFLFPVVITEGLSQVDEAAQFYVINTRAKRMDVALTRRLLIENGRIKDLADVKPWEIKAVRVTIDMNKKFRNNPWYGSIRQPNEEKMSTHVATEKSFVTSLRNLLLPGKLSTEKAAKKLAFFWMAIKENIPEAFDEPRKYLIQKTHGMFCFNFYIAPYFIKKYNIRDYTKRLRGLKDIGADFWKRSNKVGAKRYGTGMGGYANLADYIKGNL